jgi:fructoselysine-6-P-deglycase FrlB-like protein
MSLSMTDRTPMLEDVGRQPGVLAGLLTRADEFRAAGASLGGRKGRVFVTSCGDGHFAAEAAGDFAGRLGLDWRASGPLDLLLAGDTLRDDDRVIAVSMSGNVDRTVEAAAMADARGLAILALVNGAGGKLGAIARTKISLDLPDVASFLCGTASYTATLSAMMLLAEGMAGAAGGDLAALVGAQEQALALAGPVVAEIAARRVPGIRILSAGCEKGTAAYGAAKFVELTRLPAWSGELEEFAHSQYWSMPVGTLVVLIATDPLLADYARESARALAILDVPTLAIDTAASAVDTATWRITLPATQPSLSPLASALPLQQLAYAMAKAEGLDPNTRLHLKNDETRFRVSRMLTRRSLLGTGL